MVFLTHFIPLAFSSDEDYTNAQAFILTFSLNNYARDDPKFKVAMQWESEFLKVVQDYQNNPAANFTFAYMAEVQYTVGSQMTDYLSFTTVSYLAKCSEKRKPCSYQLQCR